jgi:hypothetical protein
MNLDLTAALVVALVVAAWRFGRRRSRYETGAMPSVGNAPPGAEPIARYRLNDDGLGAYSLDLSGGSATRGEQEAPIDRKG